MIIANNTTHRSFLTNYNNQNNQLQLSMVRLSSGMRIIQPGEAPADLGISERFRAQIRNSEEAGRIIQNAINMLQTSDSFLQEAHNILDRMSELAIASADGSKNQADRKNLDLEFQQLKAEIARISEAGKYNGVQVNGKTAVSLYDTHKHKIVYSQGDGSDVRELDINFEDGTTAANGIEYAFESAATSQVLGDYLFTDDGRNLVYVAQKSVGTLSARKTLMKLDLESNTLTTVALTSAGGTSAGLQPRLVQDEKGRIWVSDPSTNATAANKMFNVKLLDVNGMSLDAGGTGATNEWTGSVKLASGFSEFSVHNDFVYFIERSGNAASGKLRLVKQSIYDTTNKETLLYDLSGSTWDFDKGETYAISQDGQYVAFEDEDGTAGTIVVVNTRTGEKVSQSLGTRTNSIAALSFDANNHLYWTDTGNTSDDNALKRLKIEEIDGEPALTNIEILKTGTVGSLGAYNSTQAALGMGLSIGGGSPASVYNFQVGADASMHVDFVTADIRLVKLGLSTLSVDSVEGARDAVEAVARAVDIVANQRAILGSQVSRLNFSFSSNAEFGNNMASAESRIRDVDIASETAKMTNSQILAQTGISVLAQSNNAKQNILRLLQ